MKMPAPLAELPTRPLDETKNLIKLWQVLMEYESPERVETFFRAMYRVHEWPVKGD